MNRVFVVGCVVLGLAVLGCGSSTDDANPDARVTPPGKKSVQSSRPKQQNPDTANAVRSIAQPRKELSSAVSPKEEEKSEPASDDAPMPAKPSEGKFLLTPSDFKFVGSYPFSANGQAIYGMGLTHRRVKGQLRFLTVSYNDGRGNPARLIEFALPRSVGQRITTLTNHWDDVWSPLPYPNVGGGDKYGLWWEDQGKGEGRLWTTHATDYPGNGTKPGQASCPLAIAVRKLKPDGKIAELAGEYGFEDVGQRAIFGGIQPIPQWFRRKYGISQPYVVGWGGYTSRMAEGLVPSLGLMMLAIPEPTKYAANTVIGTKEFKLLADHRSGTTHNRDWYAAGKPSSFDRGRRNPDVVNYCDGGDKRQNPKTPPSAPPDAGAQWLSPAPDGFGRFVWTDTFLNTGCWIDGPKKGGFLVVGSFAKGKSFYMESALHSEGRHAELQIFAPNDFGKVLLGKMAPWAVQPAASKLLNQDLAPLGLLYSGNTRHGAVTGATFDAKTGRLYLWCPGVKDKNECRLVVYKVNY